MAGHTLSLWHHPLKEGKMFYRGLLLLDFHHLSGICKANTDVEGTQAQEKPEKSNSEVSFKGQRCLTCPPSGVLGEVVVYNLVIDPLLSLPIVPRICDVLIPGPFPLKP